MTRIQASRRHQAPVEPLVVVTPQPRGRGRGIHHVEAKAPALPSADANSGTQTGMTTSSANRGTGDQRRVIVNPHRAASNNPLPPIPSASSISWDSSESSEEYDLGKKQAKSVPATLVSPTGQSKRQRDSKLREPGASPSLGCLPAVTAEPLATRGT